VVGSLADDDGDRWSDLDLTFAVADALPVTDVLGDWTRRLADEVGAVELFDLPSGASIYRVFLLPDASSSISPSRRLRPSARRARSSDCCSARPWRSRTCSRPTRMSSSATPCITRCARFCIERGRYWQAEYWVSGVRDYALSLACRARGLPTSHGRGFDELPDDVRDGFADALVLSLERDELLRALGSAIAGLLREASEVRDLAATTEPGLRALTAA
jgi:hypothetical protein